MATELTLVASRILEALNYLQVFGKPPSASPDPETHVKKSYRRLSRIVHPDTQAGKENNALATEAFQRLTHYYRQALTAASKGRYQNPPLLTIATKQHTHIVTTLAERGDIGNLYRGTTRTKNGEAHASIIKIARSGRDDDLLEAEAKAIRKLRAPDTDQRLHPYLPVLLDAFLYENRGDRRRTNVIGYLDGFATFAEVRNAYAQGVHPLDMAWMWRRLLVAVGYAHRNGVIHGAVLPPHIMIHPAMHGLVLIDWCHSAARNGRTAAPPIKLISPPYRAWYPPEVLAKKPPSPATDIYLAAQSTVYLLGGDPVRGTFPDVVPKRMQEFFLGCVPKSQHSRPRDAWELLQEFDDLLERLGDPYFPRRFRPFHLPS